MLCGKQCHSFWKRNIEVKPTPTEQHSGMEITLRRRTLTKIDDSTITSPPCGVALECIGHARRLRDLCCKRGGYHVEVVSARTEMLCAFVPCRNSTDQ